MARSTTKSSPVNSDLVAQVTAAVLASLQGSTPEAKPTASQRIRKARTEAKSAPVPRRVKPENVDRAASMRAVCGAFFEAFQVIYGEKLSGWPTLGDLEAIRDDLQARIG